MTDIRSLHYKCPHCGSDDILEHADSCPYADVVSEGREKFGRRNWTNDPLPEREPFFSFRLYFRVVDFAIGFAFGGFVILIIVEVFKR